MPEDPTPPDWITPGAPVVVYSTARSTDAEGSGSYYVTTVRTVAKLSFTVTDERFAEDRFRLSDLRTKDLGSSYNPWHYRVIHPDDPLVRVMKFRNRRANARHEVVRAAEAWLSKHGRDDTAELSALRAAVQEYDTRTERWVVEEERYREATRKA